VARVVTAPGHTAAFREQKVRAPFGGTLLELTPVDGDIVHRGQVVGTIVSKDSEAAVAGAREMERDAKTPAEKEDAARAAALAEKNLVRAVIRASADGAVLSHAAAPGDRVTEDQELLTIADRGSFVFLADVVQSELALVRPGQAAPVDLAGSPRPIPGVVHDVLPTANAGDFTAPVRIDLKRLPASASIGLYGTARITVGEHADVAVVPEAAVLRDDVSGVSRIALVQNGHAHWLTVTTGLKGPGGVEIVSPPLQPGDAVIVSGQVGLPEGAGVVARAETVAPSATPHG
jgi:RND family efflux transporter MFP subunit